MPATQICLFDEPSVKLNLFPLTLTRSCAQLRIGALTIQEKWQSDLRSEVRLLNPGMGSTQNQDQGEHIYIAAHLLPNDDLLTEITELQPQELIESEEGELIAFRSNKPFAHPASDVCVENYAKKTCAAAVGSIKNLWNLLELHEEEIRADFIRLKNQAGTQNELPAYVRLLGDRNQLLIEQGVNFEHVTINCTKGPVILRKNCQLLDGAIIRGPVVVCENASLKMAAKIYGPTTIGPHCKVGGEVNSSILIGYSNKGHDGFLGHSVLGEWCNLGADTNNSNLKNNYTSVQLHNYTKMRKVDTGLTFCGLFMGDHSKCGINTMFNTGTVVGAFANIFGAGFQPKYIPSFTWGGSEWLRTYNFEKAIETAEIVMKRRGIELDDILRNQYKSLFETTAKYREKARVK